MNLDKLTAKIQSHVGAEPDGKWGPDTAVRVAAALKIEQGVTTLADDLVDERSEKVIATLLPEVRPYARALIHKAGEQGISIKAISGTRTYAEQDALYAQGRTKPGKKVTNARAGHSNHNFGIAFDIGVFDGTRYVPESSSYKAIGALGRELGLTWGGDWTSIRDEPHFQLRPPWAENMNEAAMLTELRRRHDAGKPAF